ncbi:hypothetical protein [Larkinella arboricola]
MSFSSNSRKESTDSHAAERMGNTQGLPPGQDQLANTARVGGPLPSEAHQSNDVDVSDILPVSEQKTKNATETNNSNSATNMVEVTDESLARDDDGGLGDSTWAEDRVPGADWNRDTEETKALGHS